jgi:hypothetical protein
MMRFSSFTALMVRYEYARRVTVMTSSNSAKV